VSELPNNQILKDYLASGDPAFIAGLIARTRSATQFGELVQLGTFRKRARAKGLLQPSGRKRRIALIGGASLRPMVDFIEHFASILGGIDCEMWTGDFDNYHAEALDPGSDLFEFKPDIVLVLPSERRCVYQGPLASSRAEQEESGRTVVRDLLDLCQSIHTHSKAEIVLGNFRLSPYFDPGAIRSTSLVSTYAYRKFVNMELGFAAPSYVHICDIEFLSNRRGNLSGVDDRTWFESKQPFASDLMIDVAREYAHVLSNLGKPAKKVVVLDLDNTLWGGIIGDDGLEGIELGTTSPRGEAFRDFQQYLLELSKRGILLAVCSKNDHDKAIEPFEKHPEMVLRLKDIVCFKANWEPKSENIKAIARELNLGIDSLVFVDDNPAEIEIVNQFVPEVSTVWVGDDPSEFAPKLKDSRLFELRQVTNEDLQRVQQYKQESERQQLMHTATDMDSYLGSLEMVGVITPFNAIDVPRIAQLIAKSNQFNLTTRRRTEAEVAALIGDSSYAGFTMRISDKFGEHGLISIVIGHVSGEDFEIDTWLMSCRVLKRQVEDAVLNEIVRLAQQHGSQRVIGRYIPSAKNSMVSDHYAKMGFTPYSKDSDGIQSYELAVASFMPIATKIRMEQGE
jgi:FkbH-like protein